jgi:hypothetical protein
MSWACPNAKRAKGRLRFVGEPEWSCVSHCALCHGRGYVKRCVACQGCGLQDGTLCTVCRGKGKLPDDAVRSGVAQ